MSGPVDGTDAGADGDPAGGPDELDRLCGLILAPERGRLATLERRLDDPESRAEEVADVLPDALARASRAGERLTLSLTPAVEASLEASIRRNRRRLAEALAPAMGPAIRRAIAETLRAMVESFNQVLQNSLSPRALRWRLEAWRSGRPFAEVVLSHSLVYRVEQVFLVHRASGLLLQHVSADRTASQDGDLVSGMLTAIQDFVRDSFAVSAEEAVDTMRVGSLTVMVEQGTEAYLAAVVRGTPPVGLRAVLRDALESIHVDLAEAFEAFSGDPAPFDAAAGHLEGCLQLGVRDTEVRRSWLAPAVLAGAVALLLLSWLALSVRAGRRWDAYVARLRAEPGIVVVAERGGVFRSEITGLRDPYAADPAKLLIAMGLDASHVIGSWHPYLAQDPAIVVARARAVLRPPPGVELSLAGDVLKAAGAAPHAWVTRATETAAAVPGVARLDVSHLEDQGMTAVALARARLGELVVRFDPGSAVPPRDAAATLDRTLAELDELTRVAHDAGIEVRVDVVGHTDATGSEGGNVRLSRLRAEWVASAIEARGVRGLRLGVVGVGAERPLRSETTAEDRALNRSVTFETVVER